MGWSCPYVFRNPFASSICPIPSPDETIFILHQINQSKSPEKRLPIEILLRINKEAQRNTVWEEIRTTWIPVLYEEPSKLGGFRRGTSPLQARLDLETKGYRRIGKTKLGSNPVWLPSELDRFGDEIELGSIDETQELCGQISSADLLYRLRCYFPEATIDSDVDLCECVWKMCIRHNPTDLLLGFYDYHGGALFQVTYKLKGEYQRNIDSDTKTDLEEAFSADAIRFLNALFETVDGSRRLSFYHPAAYADIPADNEHYTAVPYDCVRERCFEEDDYFEGEGPVAVYNKWRTTEVSPSDISSFRSILPDLKYDIPSRKIDPSNGTANLTAVISSPLLFYRLICKFMLGHNHTNVNQVPPITSVWQIQLIHEETGASIIFMDHYGLFDIRADAKTEEVMSDIQTLVELICSDACTHPYDGVVAGCVA